MKNKQLQINNSTNSTNKQKKERPYPFLDYSITDVQKRNQIVCQIIDNTPREKLTSYYLTELSNYLTETQKNKKERTIVTANRLITINKRETSFQGLAEKFESGQNNIYNFMTGGDKEILLVPKISITEHDLKTIPGLKELKQEIHKVEQRLAAAEGKEKSLLIKQLIEMRQDQYVLKGAYNPAISLMKVTQNINDINLDEQIHLNQKQEPVSNGLVSLFNQHHIACLLNNYTKLKSSCQGHFNSDWWYLMQDFDDLIIRALKNDYPILYDILWYKIEGYSLQDIKEQLQNKHNVKYSIEFISLAWCKKIPKIIAKKAKQEWVLWYYKKEKKDSWKKCSRCHAKKPAHHYFFTRNKTAKDGWYSMCKQCRNKKILINEDKKN